jgi:predicted amidohydrolase YtcJ
LEFDVVVRGGMVFDGSGRPPMRADVGIAGDRVTAVGSLGAAGAVDVVDAVGLSVAPGFIDSHTHSDLACFPGAEHDDLIHAAVRNLRVAIDPAYRHPARFCQRAPGREKRRDDSRTPWARPERGLARCGC